jgi:hypothetical protein
MRKVLLIAVAAMMATIDIQAQRLEIVDSDGTPVSYASVMTQDAKYIGITNLDGVIADAKGATDIVISHVAYKTKNVRLSGSNERIILEDADFGLSEITVQPKPYVYVQTYYRMYAYYSNNGIAYYRVGLTDNVYDRSNKKVKGSTNHVAKAKYGVLKFVLGLFGSLFDNHSQIRVSKLENRLIKRGEDVGLKITDLAPGRRVITDTLDTIGYIIDDPAAKQRHFSYSISKMRNHELEVKGKEKQLAKREKREEKQKNKEESDFQIFHIDEDGNYLPEDFMMKQNMDSYDEMEEGEMVHKIFCIQVFATDRAYCTKEELKQRKKDNQLKLTYDNIRKFEREHNIPALAPAVQKRLDELWKVDEEKVDEEKVDE